LAKLQAPSTKSQTNPNDQGLNDRNGGMIASVIWICVLVLVCDLVLEI
jgi:hypothetical protein